MDYIRKIKVLHIHTLPVISGSGINTFLTMKLSENIFESSIACRPGGKLEELVKSNNFEFYPINNFRAPVNPARDIMALYELYKLLKTYNFDIIHTHNSKAGFIGRLAGRLAGNVKIVHTVHGFAFHSKEKWHKRILFLLLEKLAANWVDRLIFISQPLMDWAKNEGLIKCAFKKIYSGIDVENFKPADAKTKFEIKQKLNVKETDFVIGEVAKLWEGKGHQTIIEAVKILKPKIPGLKVLFIGEGYLRAELENSVNKYGLQETVIFTGFIENVCDYNSILDISLLISDFEGMGRVILESMICGSPVIAAEVGGIVDIIKNYETGLLVEASNPKMLSEKIMELYCSPDLRKKLAANATKRLSAEFTAKEMASRINEIYRSLMF
ncbi:MAG TPA: glycosyltransferase family 4 protein [bacterium]|nr:glycosyltransferase family 4 protein [bacterium]HPN31948.1 glycosyltransferase family 4 protein [bacterium]